MMKRLTPEKAEKTHPVGIIHMLSGNTGVGTRTPDLRIMRPHRNRSNDSRLKDLRQADSAVAHHLPTDDCKTDPRLVQVVAAWPGLPEAVRSGILAMVRACCVGKE